MKSQTAVLFKKLIRILVPSLVVILSPGGTGLSSAQDGKGAVRVNNLTRSLEVLSAEKDGGHIKISMRNNSDQAITSYAFTFNAAPQTVEKFREEFATSEAYLAIVPGGVFNRELGFSPSFNEPGDITLNLVAVVFEDKSSEGDPLTIRQIEDDRLGQKVQLTRALPVLERLLSMGDAELVSYFDQEAPGELEAALDAPAGGQIRQLREGNGRALNRAEPERASERLQAALRQGKASVLNGYQELKRQAELQGSASLRGSIAELKQTYEKIIARL